MIGTKRLTTAQAIIGFLKNQFVERDGKQHPFFAGALGGKLVAHYIQGPGSANPHQMWVVVGVVGIASTLLMVLYDRVLAPRPAGA